MKKDLLTLAEQYQKNHKWKDAIECYEQYMNANADSADIVYRSYAKCLRMAGKTNQAMEILRKAIDLYPQNELILVEFLKLYDLLGDWEAIKSVAASLIDFNPEHADYYFELGRAYAYLRNKKQAEQSYKTGLTYKHGLSYENLVEKIKKGFTDQPNDFASSYVFWGGKSNFGAIIHENDDKKYFTKITHNNRGSQREKTFYKDIYNQFPVLKEIVPAYIDVQVIDNIQYLTVEMIEASKKDKPIEKVIRTSSKISTISYQAIIKEYPNPDFLFQLKNKAYYIIIFFTRIHEKYYNQKLFSDLKLFSQQRHLPEKAAHIISHLESLIMDNQLYKFIQPEEHYSLLHGDFKPPNIKVKSDGSLSVFDWTNFVIGPHFMDIARCVTATFTPYSFVRETYLFNEHENGNMRVIEQIFFLYAFILIHFVVLPNRNIDLDKSISEFIYPALVDMEACISQFKQEESGFSEFIVEALLYDNKTKILENKKMEKRNSTLKKEKDKVRFKLNHVLHSKSWRITAPFRRLMKRMK